MLVASGILPGVGEAVRRSILGLVAPPSLLLHLSAKRVAMSPFSPSQLDLRVLFIFFVVRREVISGVSGVSRVVIACVGRTLARRTLSDGHVEGVAVA